MPRRSVLKVGDVVVVELPEHDPPGREQQGKRPAVVVGFPEVLGQPRFSMVLLVPLTSDKGEAWPRLAPALYPILPAGTAGLLSDSVCLLDQVRAVDVDRIKGRGGALDEGELRPIRDGLRRVLGFDGEENAPSEAESPSGGLDDVASALRRAGVSCASTPGNSEDARRAREMPGVPEDVRDRVAEPGGRVLEVAGAALLFFDGDGRYAGARATNDSPTFSRSDKPSGPSEDAT